MQKIKFMLLSLALVAVVGGALALKAKNNTSFCTTFAQRANAGSPWTCSISGQPLLTCPTLIPAATVKDCLVGGVRPVCTQLPVNGTCGDAANPLQCINATICTAADL